ncbi:MAG TPA: hypothetical protein VIU11_20695 [Nakamurella sp.]
MAPEFSYADHTSGVTFKVGRPASDRSLWHEYLEGAQNSYQRYGVERVLDLAAIRDGRTTRFFFAAIDDNGRVVGGTRVQGPYQSALEAHALVEWAGRSGRTELYRRIKQRVLDGVIEVKTAWASDCVDQRNELSAAIARTFVHAVALAPVRFGLCTGAQHAVPRWRSVGGEVDPDVKPVAYPDRRYRTVPMWWDDWTMHRKSDSMQRRHLEHEWTQIMLSLTATDAVA